MEIDKESHKVLQHRLAGLHQRIETLRWQQERARDGVKTYERAVELFGEELLQRETAVQAIESTLRDHGLDVAAKEALEFGGHSPGGRAEEIVAALKKRHH
jgi:hypothetical protein